MNFALFNHLQPLLEKRREVSVNVNFVRADPQNSSVVGHGKVRGVPNPGTKDLNFDDYHRPGWLQSAGNTLLDP